MKKKKFEDKGTKDTASMKIFDDPVIDTSSAPNKVELGVQVGRKGTSTSYSVEKCAHTNPD